MKCTINQWDQVYQCTITTHEYADGNGLAVRLMEDGRGPYCTLSVNFIDAPKLEKNEFYLKHWSENEGIAEQLIEQGCIEIVQPPKIAEKMAYAFRLIDPLITKQSPWNAK